MARVLLLIALAASALVACRADPPPNPGLPNSHKDYDIGLWGDLPYSTTQASSGMDNLIADMNSFNLAFTVHDGDIKTGSSPCTNDQYSQFQSILSRLQAPAAYTPGDNEWTDCDRAKAGSFNSLERLDYIRAQFFTTSRTQGGVKTLEQMVQTETLCLNASHGNVSCSENRLWSYAGVTYVTVNVPGSCNNLCDINPDPVEYAARNGANIKWLQTAFQSAKTANSVAVMIISQADPGFGDEDSISGIPRDPKNLTQLDKDPDGFRDYLLALRTEVLAFGKPVAYVHGDSHYGRIDKPFTDSNGYRINKFTRVETPGDHNENGNNDVNWIKVTVDLSNREVFTYTFMVTPGNGRRKH